MSQQEFLFVNPGNRSRASKISTTGRAFVIRKARAANPWSTTRKSGKTTSISGTGKTVTLNGEPLARSESKAIGALAPNRDLAARQSPLVSVSVDLVPESRSRKNGGDAAMAATAPGQAQQDVRLVEPRNKTRSRKNPRCPQCRLAWRVCSCFSASGTHVLSGRFDPFSSLAVELKNGDENLLTYFTTTVAPSISPLTGNGRQAVEVQKYWVTVSFYHSGFMHAILCLAALQLAIAEPHRSPFLVERFMHHRLEAISSVHRDLGDAERALSDENIATVFNLLCIEENLFLHASDALAINPAWRHLQPDTAQRQAHLDGLKRMLALRGGVAQLGEMRGLQAFLIRWVCTSLGCRITFGLPRMYNPQGQMERDAAELADQTFAASTLFPKGLLARLYKYPESSPFYHEGSRMADSCGSVGMHPELLHHILTIECLLKDATAMAMRPDSYNLDFLDIQNLFSLVLGELVRWNLENEATLTATENVTAICLFMFIFLVGNGAHGACSPLPGIMPRLRQHFLDPHLKIQLQAAGIEIWAALLLLMSSTENPASGEFFFRYYIEALAGREPLAKTFEDLHAMLQNCVWAPHMDPNARKAWDESLEVWESVRDIAAEYPGVIASLTRPRPNDLHARPTIPLSNPYATSHMKKLFGPVGAH